MSQATCISESEYSEALTYGKRYEVLAYEGDKEQVRVKGDNGRTRWFPKICFDLTGKKLAVIDNFTIDDPIHDPKCDCVEVTVKMSTGRRRWCFFVTPGWLSGYLNSTIEPKLIDNDGFIMHQITYLGDSITSKTGTRFEAIHVPHMIIVPEMTVEIIEATLRHIEKQGELRQCTRSL